MNNTSISPFKKPKTIVEIARRHHLPEGLTYEELREYLKELIIKIDRIKRNARDRLNELRIQERKGMPVKKKEINDLLRMIKGLKYEREELIIVLSKVNKKIKDTRRRLNGDFALNFHKEFVSIAKQILPENVYREIHKKAEERLKNKEALINDVVSYKELEKI